mgnify:FL=1
MDNHKSNYFNDKKANTKTYYNKCVAKAPEF